MEVLTRQLGTEDERRKGYERGPPDRLGKLDKNFGSPASEVVGLEGENLRLLCC